MKRFWLAARILLLGFAGTAFAAPFQNGSFDVGAPAICNPNAPALAQGSTAIPGWTVSVGNIEWACTGNWTASDGTYSLDLIGTATSIGGVQQTFDTIPGATYQVSFDLAGNPSLAFPPAIKPLAVSVAGTTRNYTFDTSTHVPPNPMGWVTQTFTFVANGISATIDFRSDVGSSSFAGAALDNVRITVVPATTSTTLASSANPSAAGSSVTLTATVTGTNNPTGIVQFTDGGSTIAECSAPVTLTGTDNTKTATCTTSAFAVGNHSIVAYYVGDTSNNSSQSPLTQVVNAVPIGAIPWTGSAGSVTNAGVLVPPGTSPPYPGDAIGSSPTVVSDGTTGPAVFTYETVNSFCCHTGDWTFQTTAAAGGNVGLNWTYSGYHGTCQAQASLTAFVERGGSTIFSSTPYSAYDAACSYGLPAGGFGEYGQVVLFVEPGDIYGFRMHASNYDSNGGVQGHLTVTTGTLPTTTTLNSSISPAPYLTTINFTATVAGSSTAPTGTVTFTQDGRMILGCVAIPLVGNSAVCSTNGLASGTRNIIALYSGDTVNAGAVSTLLLQTVDLPLPPPNFVVNDTADAADANPGDGICADSSSRCTLRAAIMEANALAGTETITVPAGTYALGIGALAISGNVTINGAGAASTIVDGGGADRVFTVNSGVVVIFGLTVRNGHVNSANAGAGIANSGSLTLDEVVVSGNGSEGDAGGIFNQGTLSLDSSTVAGNVGGGGAGIYSFNGTLTLTNSTVSGNHSIGVGQCGFGGGGLWIYGGQATITSSTLFENFAECSPGFGGRGHAIASTGAAVTIQNSILASPAQGAQVCYGVVTSLGYNLAGDSTCGPVATDLIFPDPQLYALDIYGGPTPTHELNLGSPARDAVPIANCATALDQQGNVRPQGPGCDIGAVESTPLPIQVPTTTTLASLPNPAVVGASVTYTATVTTTVSGSNPQGVVDFFNGTSLVLGTCSAVPLTGTGDSRTAVCTTSVLAEGSWLVTARYNGDINHQSSSGTTTQVINAPAPALAAPTLVRVVATSSNAAFVIGRADGVPGTSVSFDVYTASSCSAGALVGGTRVGTTSFTANKDTSGFFGVTIPNVIFPNVISGNFVAVQLTAPASEMSACLVSSGDNDFWPKALPVVDGSPSPRDYIDTSGKARWYKFSVTPGQKITVALSGLPADYDLAVFKDINKAFVSQLSGDPTAALTKLSAEFAPSTFSPSTFSPSTFSPSTFSPDAYAPSTFSPSTFSPSLYSPSTFSPSTFSPSTFSPSTFSPSTFSPSTFSPSTFSPSTFSPSTFSPATVLNLDPDQVKQAFSSAQTRSLVAVSATPGNGDESAVVNTWNDTGDFYVRVSGRGGAFSTNGEFTLNVVKGPTTCGLVTNPPPGLALAARGTVTGSSHETIILTDSNKVGGDSATLLARLGSLAGRVAGAVVDLKNDARVLAYRAQAEAHADCPYATNLLAQEIKSVVDAYRVTNPLKYVVIAGNDGVIPYFRYPDESLLGQESAYAPPVRSDSASEASLRQDFVLSQDAYGSSTSISMRGIDFPIPGLAVGRLVETPAEMARVIDAFLANGIVAPTSSLVTGYDFLADAAGAVTTELQTAGAAPQSLVSANGVPPSSSWTATQLRSALFGSRHDVIFLAGHFSANSALAADFTTTLLTTDLAASTTDFTNSIVFSAGCHAGYNIVDSDAIDGVTMKLDWPQAFAQKGATLIAGTGYQYGDTEFIEYSERLYKNFARQLRAGTTGTTVAVGEALVRAKLDYLAATPEIRGIHQKALLEATVFGLPMLGVNMPTGRDPNPATPGVIDTSATSQMSTLATGPAGAIGLRIAPLSLAPSLGESYLCLRNPPYDTVLGAPPVDCPPPNTSYTKATWLTGLDGVTSNPAEPVLPLQIVNVTPTTNVVLRGVGFVGGSYTESTVVPLTGAPTTELRGVHTPFLSPVFFPMRLSTPNYFGALSGSGGTKLLLTPVQHKAANVADGTSTRRTFTNLDLRLYYSGNTTATALSAAPTIVSVRAVPDAGGLTFTAQVLGDPAAGIHEVWVTYTGDSGPGAWTSLSLTQCSVTPPAVTPPAMCGTTTDSQTWMGQLVSPPASLKYIVQAVNGIGLVSADDNLGAYYSARGTTLVGTSGAPVATALALVSPPTMATYGGSTPVSATLSADATPVAGKLVTITVGGASQSGMTAADGSVTVSVPISSVPGTYQLTASFAGDQGYLPSSINSGGGFIVNKAASTLAALPSPAGTLPAFGATLTGTIGSKSQPIDGPVAFTLTSAGGSPTVFANTNYLGQATLPPPGLAAGTYTVTGASFGGNATYNGTTVVLAQTITVPKADQTITFVPLGVKTFGDPPFAVSASASSGLAVTFAASGNCTLPPGSATVTLTGAGNCTITASAPGNDDYNAANAAQIFSIALAATGTVLTSDKNLPVPYGTTINLKATVTPATATGSVTFFDNATTLTSKPLVAGGTATLPTSTLAVGTHSLTASYGGDANDAPSPPSAPLTLTIKEAYTATAPMLQARVSHTATLLNDGRVLVAGGSALGDDDRRAGRTAEIYCPDPYTPPATPVRTLAQWCPNGVGKFSAAGRANTAQVGVGNLVQARAYHTATLLPNGTVLLAGGYDSSGITTATAEIYDTADPIADKFTAVANLPGNAAAGHTATVITKTVAGTPKTYVLVVGGGSVKSWLYDVQAKTWSLSGAMTGVRSNHTASLVGSKVLIAGGTDALGRTLQTTTIYDIAAGTFASGPTMLAPRELHTASAIANGKILFAGGRASTGIITNSVALNALAEIYDPGNATTPFVASTFASGTGRFGHSASALIAANGQPDGRVLVAGGGVNVVCGQQLAATELFASGAFTSGAAMSAARVRHTATVLKDGRVLVAGGRGATGGSCGPLKTAEIWNGPASP